MVDALGFDEFVKLEPNVLQQMLRMDRGEIESLLKMRKETGKSFNELIVSDDEFNALFGK